MSARLETPKLIAKQVAGALLALLLSSFVVFSTLYLAPGDPLTVLSGGRSLSPAAREAISQQYHLEDPFFSRYWQWLGDAVQGDFGRSVISKVPVSTLIGPRLGTTALLIGMAGLFTVLAGVGAGLAGGLGGRRTRTLTTGATSLALAIPPFVAATILISVFAIDFGWFPVFGSGSGLADQIYHLVLPAIALGLGGSAYVARVASVSIDRAARSEYAETARARGLTRPQVVRRHVLRNALIPITTVAGISFAGLIATAVVVESAFGVSGLGDLLVKSVLAKDFAVVQAISLILIAGFIAVNLAVDLLYARLDPRLRGPSRS